MDIKVKESAQGEQEAVHNRVQFGEAYWKNRFLRVAYAAGVSERQISNLTSVATIGVIEGGVDAGVMVGYHW